MIAIAHALAERRPMVEPWLALVTPAGIAAAVALWAASGGPPNPPASPPDERPPARRPARRTDGRRTNGGRT